MSLRSKCDMMEATRLTRQGRLEETMAVLRGSSTRADLSAARSEGESDGNQSDATDRLASFIDMMPPSPGTGNVWTAPPWVRRSSAAHRSATARQSHAMSEGILDRLRNDVGASGLDGLIARSRIRCRRLCRTVRRSRLTPLPTRRVAEPTSSTCRAVTKARRSRLW